MNENESEKWTDLQTTLSELEHALGELGEDLQFLVLPKGGLEVVRRGEDGRPRRPKEVVMALKGSDPLMWQPDRTLPAGERGPRLAIVRSLALVLFSMLEELPEDEDPRPSLEELLRARGAGSTT